MANIAGIRLREAGKIFYYDAGDLELNVSNYVVVESSHGLTVGRVVVAPDQVIANESRDEVRPILRLATQEDVERHNQLREKAKQDAEQTRQAIADSGLPMSLAGGEYDLEGEHFTAFFTAPDRIDFRNLTRDLSRDLGVKVQFVQVGDRDRAKLVDGFDICGERLCCSSWMTAFPSVSIRMAKEQDLPLNPQKISGVCGRLYCCLTFEYEEYKALRGTLPKVGSMVSTPIGEAKISSIDFIRERVKLYLPESRQTFDMAVVDLQLQHGVTVRPMELVRQVEGPMRPITEDRSTRAPERRPPGRRGADRRPADRRPPEAGTPDRAPQAGAEARTADQQTERQIEQALREGGRGGRPRPEPAARPPGEAQGSPQATQGDGGESGQRRRRRRRGRGRGGGSGGVDPGPGGPAA
jgi:cell fate regulator YaaT (PSP1 superfamily)